MKPILFNTEEVRALLAGRKSVTRRVVKPQPTFFYTYGGKIADPDDPDNIAFLAMTEKNGEDMEEIYVPPYQPGSVLYVRETFFKYAGECVYRASAAQPELWNGMWRPSIHMPREAARLFLQVTDVRVERLQDITDDALARDFGFCLDAIKVVGRDALAAPFWDSTLKKTDRPLYGWDANPWVWVIEFERISKEDAYGS